MLIPGDKAPLCQNLKINKIDKIFMFSVKKQSTSP